MLFSIFAYDVENSLALRIQARPAHLARLEDLDQAGRLIIAGPNPNIEGEGFSGSLIVAKFDSLEAADLWASEDPYLSAGVYDRVEVKPFKQVFPKA